MTPRINKALVKQNNNRVEVHIFPVVVRNYLSPHDLISSKFYQISAVLSWNSVYFFFKKWLGAIFKYYFLTEQNNCGYRIPLHYVQPHKILHVCTIYIAYICRHHCKHDDSRTKKSEFRLSRIFSTANCVTMVFMMYSKYLNMYQRSNKDFP